MAPCIVEVKLIIILCTQKCKLITVESGFFFKQVYKINFKYINIIKTYLKAKQYFYVKCNRNIIINW